MKTSIVIPVFNNYAGLHQLLWDLYKNCKTSIDEVVIVNDASTEDIVDGGLKWWWSRQMLPMRIHNNPKNQGFLKSSNTGMGIASGDILLLISTDVRVHYNVVRNAEEILATFPDDEVGGRLLNEDTGWNKFGDIFYPYLEGWLIGFRKELWQKLGGFDEQYAPSDFEDIDISTAVVANGGTLIQLEPHGKDKLDHKGGGSIGFNPEREKITIRNKELFRQKWVK